jgi:hypothetical protein
MRWLLRPLKQKILQVAERLPDTATLEDAIERLYFLEKVEEGICQSDAGETVSTPRPFVRSVDDPTVHEVIQDSYRIVYRLIREEIHIVTVHHSARLFSLEP